MRVVTYLPRLKQRHVRQLDKILDELVRGSGLTNAERDQLVARSVIGAMNSYDRFCRYLYVSSAMGARDASGVRVVSRADRQPSEIAAVQHAFSTLNPHIQPAARRQEPDWKVPAQLLASLSAVNAANQADVAAALSAQTKAIHTLPVFRNFYAHRGQDTAVRAQNQARRLAITPSHPTDILMSTSFSVDPLVVDWIFDLQTIVDMMA